MFKRLMIGLFALSLAAIWLSEANARDVRRRRSVGVTVTFGSVEDLTGDTVPFTTEVFGLPADADGNCGEVKGELYCAQDGSPEARLACDAATGDSAVLVAVLDKNAIPAGLSPGDYNFNDKAFGQRLELRYFKENSLLETSKTIFLPAGDKKTVGWFFIEDAGVDDWNPAGDLTTSEALHRFTSFEWKSSLGKYITDDGFGINGEQFISKVPLESYYGEGLEIIVGKTICSVWHHDQVKGDTLKGNYYGLAAFKVLRYDESQKAVEVEIMSAPDVCGGLLYNDPKAGTDQGSYACLVDEAVVFAPAPDTENNTSVDAFEEDSDTATTKCEEKSLGSYSWTCQATVEVVLDSTKGEEFCDARFGAGTVFVDFIPIDRNDYAFIGTLESGTIPGEFFNAAVKCKEGGAEGDGIFSRYDCGLFEGDIPTCYKCVCEQAPWEYTP